MNRRRIIAGLGVALPTTLAVSVAAGPLGWLERARHLAWSKWGLGGAISALSIYTGVQLSNDSDRRMAQAPVSKAASTVRAPELPVPAAREVAPLESVGLTEVQPAPAAVPAVVRSTGAVAENRSLSDESALLESARRALVDGDTRRSLRLLDEHARKYRKPRLTAEAGVLRIEALVASGESARAAELGKRFLARQANGPYERRVRSLIGEAGPTPKSQR
jgi:hypothetical protein